MVARMRGREGRREERGKKGGGEWGKGCIYIGVCVWGKVVDEAIAMLCRYLSEVEVGLLDTMIKVNKYEITPRGRRKAREE